MRRSKRFALRFLILSAAVAAAPAAIGTRCQRVKCVGTGQRTDCSTDGVTRSTSCRFWRAETGA